MKTLTLFTAIILATLAATAQIIHVPADQPTIQEGVDASSDGDTVLVAEGTYLENINFNGMAITVASHFIMDGDTSHISNTVIDGSQPENPDIGSVVTFESGEDTTSILIGFTITGGSGSIVPENGFRVGGGINLINSGASILNNVIDNNNIIHQNFAAGGGIDAMTTFGSASLLILNNNKIINNSVTSAFQAVGGGINLGMNARIMNNVVNNNETQSYGTYSFGGGIQITPVYVPINVEIKNNHFSYNTATSTFASSGGVGGGFYITTYFGITAFFSGNKVEYNQVKGDNSYGAGAFVTRLGSDFVFENNLIRNNMASEGDCFGGGLCVWYGGGTYQNNVIHNNDATWGGGISVVHNNSDSLAIIINNTITENEANYGGGLYMNLADAVVINTVLWDNEATVEGSEIYEMESNLEVRHSNIKGEEEWPGEGNMNVDPEFRNDGYHLYYPSLLVNEGKSSILIDGEWFYAPEYDIDGDERPFDGTYPDIGADEAQWYYVSVDESVKYENIPIKNFPNPFTSSTTITFELQSKSKVELAIYNHFGQRVDLLMSEIRPEGSHQVVWNAEEYPSGIYYCGLKTKNISKTIKLIKY